MKNKKHFDVDVLRNLTQAGDVAVIGYIDMYIEQTDSEILVLESYLQKTDVKNIKMLAHNLKSKAKYFGIISLAEIAEKMEKTDSSKNNLSETGNLIIEFKKLYSVAKKEMLTEKSQLKIKCKS